MGIGLSLYFDTVKLIGYSFFAMFIFGLPSLIITFLANPEAAEKARQEGGEMAVLKVFTVAAIFKTSSADQYGCDSETCFLRTGQTVSTQLLVSIMVYLDLVYCIVFLYCIKKIEERFQRMTQDVDDDNISAADYTVSVWGIPKDCTEAQLKEHFDKYDGNVCPPERSKLEIALQRVQEQMAENLRETEEKESVDMEAPLIKEDQEVAPGVVSDFARNVSWVVSKSRLSLQ